MNIAKFKIGTKHVKGEAVSFEILDDDGKRAGTFKIKTPAPVVLANIVSADELSIKGGSDYGRHRRQSGRLRARSGRRLW
jgi:hypothetical protein